MQMAEPELNCNVLKRKNVELAYKSSSPDERKHEIFCTDPKKCHIIMIFIVFSSENENCNAKIYCNHNTCQSKCDIFLLYCAGLITISQIAVIYVVVLEDILW